MWGKSKNLPRDKTNTVNSLVNCYFVVNMVVDYKSENILKTSPKNGPLYLVD